MRHAGGYRRQPQHLDLAAHLAAIAIEHHAEVVSFDGDLTRFTGLRWRIPALAEPGRS